VDFLQLIIIATCFVLFICQMYDIYEKYAQKMTTVGIRTYSQEEKTKLLPCITVCPWQAFKKQGFFYNKALLMQEGFEKNEIFVGVKDDLAFNATEYSIEEIQSIYFGRCYMVCPVRPSRRNSGLYLFFHKSRDLKGLFELFSAKIVSYSKHN
jgi:Amiloride-sensitive sodium channel